MADMVRNVSILFLESSPQSLSEAQISQLTNSLHWNLPLAWNVLRAAAINQADDEFPVFSGLMQYPTALMWGKFKYLQWCLLCYWNLTSWRLKADRLVKLGRGRAFCRALGDDHMNQTPFRKDTLNFNVGGAAHYSKCLVGYMALHSEREKKYIRSCVFVLTTDLKHKFLWSGFADNLIYFNRMEDSRHKSSPALSFRQLPALTVLSSDVLAAVWRPNHGDCLGCVSMRRWRR